VFLLTDASESLINPPCMDKPITHLRVRDVARRLGHGRRWVLDRIADGQLKGFKWARCDVTVDEASVIAYENRARVSRDFEPNTEGTPTR